MESHLQSVRSVRNFVSLVAAVGIAWQVVVIALAFRYADPLNKLLADLGVDLPTSTRFFLASYKWWPLVPALCAAFLVLSVSRVGRSSVTAMATALISLGAGLLLQAWTNEAVVAPVRLIMQNVA